MQATRTLIGALVGLALGIAVLIVFNVNLKQDAWWTFIPVGLVAGLAMRMLASSGRPSYLRGALAAALTGVVAAVGPMITAKIFQNKAPDQVAISAPAADIEVDEETTETAVPNAQVPEVVQESRSPLPVGAIGARPNKGVQIVDALFLGAAVLIAYELGKGSTSKQEDEADEAAGEGEAAEQPPAEEPASSEA